jgi:hypothetical protein
LYQPRMMSVEQLVEEELTGETEEIWKTCPSATFSTINPTWLDLGSNLGRRDGKPATNGLNYGTALMLRLLWLELLHICCRPSGIVLSLAAQKPVETKQGIFSFVSFVSYLFIPLPLPSDIPYSFSVTFLCQSFVVDSHLYYVKTVQLIYNFIL